MSEPIRRKVTYRDVEYLETVHEKYLPAADYGMVTWEVDKDLPGLQVSFDPDVEGSLDEARFKIQAAIDWMRGGEKVPQ